MTEGQYKNNRHKPSNLTQLPADIQYLLNDKIGPVISEALNALYKEKPPHPIDYLAKWLLNHEADAENKKKIGENEEKVKEILKRYDVIAEEKQKKQAELDSIRESTERQENLFKDKLKAHEYHEELLSNDLPGFIERQKGLKAVYVGYLEHPSRPIGEDEDDELAHLDTSQPKLITYVGANGTQKFIIGRELQPETGVTYPVFEPVQVDPPAELAEGEEPVVVEPEPTSVYIPDVTKNDKMVYFRIPKLGAYLAVNLTYKSVLTEAAFDEGVKERLRFQEDKERLKSEKIEKEEDFKKRIEEAEEQGLETQEIRDEFANTEWPEAVEAAFVAEDRKFVLCVDTLGEDREVTEEERKFVISLAKLFVQNWEESENKQLSRDVDTFLEAQSKVNKEEFIETLAQKLNDEINEKYREEEGDTELKQNARKAAIAADFYRSKLAEEEVRNMIKSLAKYRVVKFKTLIQNVMYFLGFKKGQVNIPGTNVLEWKELKKQLLKDSFYTKLEEYEFRGPKEDGWWERYSLTNRLLPKFEKFNVEEIEDYNLGLAVLYRYIKQALEARLLDIQVRRENTAELKRKREEAILEDENWVQTKEREFEEALANAQAAAQAAIQQRTGGSGEEGEEEEQPEEEKWNEEEWKAQWNAQWDAEHPRGTIPDPVEDDIDLDLEKEETL